MPGNNGVNPVPPTEDPNAVMPSVPTATQATIQATPQSAEAPADGAVEGGAAEKSGAAVVTPSTTQPSPSTLPAVQVAPTPISAELPAESPATEAPDEVSVNSDASVGSLATAALNSADQTPGQIALVPKAWPVPQGGLRFVHTDLPWPRVVLESDTVYSTQSIFALDTAEQVREKLGTFCATLVEEYQKQAKEILKIDNLNNYFSQICINIDQLIAIRGITYADLDVHRRIINAQLDNAFYSAYNLPFRDVLIGLSSQKKPSESSLFSAIGIPDTLISTVEQLLLLSALVFSLFALLKDSLKNKFIKKSDSQEK